jgi:hypothetical protein
LSDDDLNDFITINITCDQACALALLLIKAHETGLFDAVLDRYGQEKLKEFTVTMSMEIQAQKTGMEK